MIRRGLTTWLACAMIFCLASAAVAQTTKPATTQAAGMFEKQPIARSPNAPAPVRSREPGKVAAPANTWDTLRVVAALAMVIVVIFLLRWIAQQFFGMPSAKKSSRAVQVLSRSMISPKQQVLLLQVGRRVIVVSDTGGQMNPLDVITDQDEIAALTGQLREDKAAPMTKSFGSIFGRAQTNFEEPVEPAPAVRRNDDDDLDPALATTQAELSGLMEKVRNLSQGMKRPEN